MHSALRGHFPTADIRGNKYIVILVDNFSRLTITSAVQEKSDMPEALQEMILKFESMVGCHIEDLWTNWGAEFRSHKFLLWLQRKDIVPHYSKTNANYAIHIEDSLYQPLFISAIPLGSCYVL